MAAPTPPTRRPNSTENTARIITAGQNLTPWMMIPAYVRYPTMVYRALFDEIRVSVCVLFIVSSFV